jgi:hypothetical protein
MEASWQMTAPSAALKKVNVVYFTAKLAILEKAFFNSLKQ